MNVKTADRTFTRRVPNRLATSPKVVKAHLWTRPSPAEPETPPPTPPSRLRRALRLTPAILLVAVSVVCVVLWRQNTGLTGDARDRKNLEDSAGKVAGVFFNWDYQHMDESFAAKYPLLTDTAANAIRPTATALTTYFTGKKVSSTASITGVYPGVIKGDDANVMVIINTEVTTDKKVQSNTGATVVISMKRIKDRWLAANITLLSSGADSAAADSAAPPIATPTPTPSS